MTQNNTYVLLFLTLIVGAFKIFKFRILIYYLRKEKVYQKDLAANITK